MLGLGTVARILLAVFALFLTFSATKPVSIVLAQTEDAAPDQSTCRIFGGCRFFRRADYRGISFSLVILCRVDNVLQGSPTPDIVAVIATITGGRDPLKFADDSFATAVFRQIRDAAQPICYKWIPQMRLSPGVDPAVLTRYRIGEYSISVEVNNQFTPLAYATISSNGALDLSNRDAKRMLQIRQSQQAAEIRQRAASNAAASLQRDFASRYGIGRWTTIDKLAANPFAFRDAVVGVSAEFIRMVAERDALFGNSLEPTLLVTGVPSTRFSSSERTILALRVLGMKSVGGAPLPYLRYVGDYRCRAYNCSDFTSP
jgi:hypothetical protein